ncbi:MAG: redoxin domain-containing protein [Chloroflexi bacterium]|nr:redoxin domain-containing protein [Chloroflexota bacterium]
MVGELGVGDTAPDFTLPDADGGETSLSEHRGHEVVLYFIREFGCSICRRHSAGLGRLYEEFKKASAEVLLVTPGDTQKAKAYAGSLGLPFTVLADASREIYRLYGLDRMALGLIQRSEIFVVNRDGVIRFAQGHGLPTAVPDANEVLEAVKSARTGADL